jgi:hypothetical protein
MSSLWDAVFIQVLDRTGPLMLNVSGTPCTYSSMAIYHGASDKSRCGVSSVVECMIEGGYRHSHVVSTPAADRIFPLAQKWIVRPDRQHFRDG